MAEATPARLELGVERFGGRQGKLFLLDLARRAGAEMGRRSGRLVFRERFRLFLKRQFTDWTLTEISAEPDLEFSLSPAFPRASLRHGQHALAAIACPPESDAAAMLSFGLIWLAHLRAREQRVTVEGLALYLPAGRERATALRLLCLDPAAARFDLFTYTERDDVVRIDPQDHGNLDTHLDTCRRAQTLRSGNLASRYGPWAVWNKCRSTMARSACESAAWNSPSFTRASSISASTERRPTRDHHLPELESLIGELNRVRSPESGVREHPLYRQYPEAWLESMARAQIEVLDASLLSAPVYGQVPAFAGGDRGILDLLAVDHTGRLAVIELKASADLHLPLQAVDYWIRVKWHLDRGEFRSARILSGN